MAGKISKHDAHIAKGLAHVLTGGSRANGIEPVDEQYLLDLEREVFVSLAGERQVSGPHGPHAQDGQAVAELIGARDRLGGHLTPQE